MAYPPYELTKNIIKIVTKNTFRIVSFIYWINQFSISHKFKIKISYKLPTYM